MSLLKPLVMVYFFSYYFKKHFKPHFFIKKALKDILQHFKFMNWWIGEFVVSFFFDVTNRLILTSCWGATFPFMVVDLGGCRRRPEGKQGRILFKNCSFLLNSESFLPSSILKSKVRTVAIQHSEADLAILTLQLCCLKLKFLFK